QTRLFVAGMSLKSGLDTQKINRFIFDKNSEALAVMCKAVGFDRNSFSAIFLLTRKGTNSSGEKLQTNPVEIENVMKFFDKLSAGKARAVLEHWKLDAGYTAAIEQLDSQLGKQRVYL
ncbi:MAG: DUF2336 domain-containing protein, partial [Sneathiella sp.]|nr:DUF2336 domain-containing protein [Sneathiella sp.]